MKIAMSVLTLIAPALAFAPSASAADKSPANYAHSFQVRRAVFFDGCVMNVTEDNVEYALIDGQLSRHICFNVGQTLQGRFDGGNVEILYTDSKGRQKTVRYQVVSEKAVTP